MSIKEIQEIMLNEKYMPTAIFSAKREDYIVKPRTIYGKSKKETKKADKLTITQENKFKNINKIT